MAHEIEETAVATAATEEDKKKPRCVIEDFVRCSESHLWKLMMSFYDRKGVSSWSQGIVPHFITCNAFIGRAYAKVLQGFIRDCVGPNAKMKLDPTQPLYIIELGAGSGKFSFFMLKALQEIADVMEFPIGKIVYVMTDFTQNNFDFWNSHPGLKPFIDAGQLDLAIFDAVNDTTIQLHHSGITLAPGTLANPICVVANYLFDTLCHDIFQVEGRELKEGLISVGSRKEVEEDLLDPEIIKRFDNHFKYEPVSDGYYDAEDAADAPHLRRILRWYREFFGDSPGGASFLLPVGALRALRRLVAFSNGRALVVSGDKGNNNPEQFRGLTDPHIAVHGSFSVMVNYHAIGLYCTSRSGFVLHNPQEEASLKVSAFVLTGDNDDAAAADDARACAANNAAHAAESETASVASAATAEGETAAGLTARWTGDDLERLSSQRAKKFPNLCHVFEDAIVRFGPNDFFVMQKSMKEDTPQPTLKAIVALLKLCEWDPDVFYKFRDVILNQVPVCGFKLRNDLCRNLPRVWANHYNLDNDKDVSFEVGRFYYGIREHEKALQFYRTSTEHIGEHHVTFHNMGLCHYSLGDLDQAMHNFNKSLGLNDAYEKARTWQHKVQREIEQRTAALVGFSLQPLAIAPPDQGDATLSQQQPSTSSDADQGQASPTNAKPTNSQQQQQQQQQQQPLIVDTHTPPVHQPAETNDRPATQQEEPPQ